MLASVKGSFAPRRKKVQRRDMWQNIQKKITTQMISKICTKPRCGGRAVTRIKDSTMHGV